MPTIAEQITAFETKRASLVAANETIMTKAAGEGTTLDAEQEESFDGNQADIEAIDKHLVRLRAMEKTVVSKAVPANGKTGAEGTASRGGHTIHIKSTEAEEKFEGQNYTRMVIAKTLARLDGISAEGIANQRWGKSNPMLAQVIKAAVAGGGTETGEWGAELAQADTRYTGDFIDFLYGQTVFDNLPLREVPANVHIKGQDGAANAYWVGQSKSIPVTTADFLDVQLAAQKVAAIAVVSKELLRDSSPSAELLVRDALVQASAQRIDQTFLSADAAVPNVSPAGILFGLTALNSAGNDVDGVIADVKALYAPFLAAKNASGLQMVANESLSKSIGLMQNVMGNWAFPGITAAGGSLLGDPLVSGSNVGASDLILLKPSDIYKIGDRGVEVSLSTEAAIQMDSAPNGASDTPTAQTGVVSMFQTESVAIKVVRPLNYAKRRASAVSYIGDADYGTPVTP
ncbi:HK97 family phage major capsid protein [Novosphingobium sp. PhB165]|uniref:phage major capsid protein n=1 Tax=Novosphingobium sp. PhB165 TaxID=2485105 RepID=UPI00104D5050|nr:phage major capsid protein [Novosphingobium sp. PhB165]TCM17217.1 HK97 family phage major capsid protein [Novosphingobium sp. PhB165]